MKRQGGLVGAAERGQLGASGRGWGVEDLPVACLMGLSTGHTPGLATGLDVHARGTADLRSVLPELRGLCALLLCRASRMAVVKHRRPMLDDPIVLAARDRVGQVRLVVILGVIALGSVR